MVALSFLDEMRQRHRYFFSLVSPRDQGFVLVGTGQGCRRQPSAAAAVAVSKRMPNSSSAIRHTASVSAGWSSVPVRA